MIGTTTPSKELIVTKGDSDRSRKASLCLSKTTWQGNIFSAEAGEKPLAGTAKFICFGEFSTVCFRVALVDVAERVEFMRSSY